MPDFNTRKPQEPNEPSRVRISLTAHRLRSLVMANRLRTVSIIGWSLLLVVVAVPVALFFYSSDGWGHVTCDTGHLFDTGECKAPSGNPMICIFKTGECKAPSGNAMICNAEYRALVDLQTSCGEGSDDYHRAGFVSCEEEKLTEVGKCVAPDEGEDFWLCREGSEGQVDWGSSAYSECYGRGEL